MKTTFLTRGILWAVSLTGALAATTEPAPPPDHRQQMRHFVIGLSQYAKKLNPAFVIIPQNGQELITANGEPEGAPQVEYIRAIDGTGREDLFFGYHRDNVATPKKETNYLVKLCGVFRKHGLAVLTTDYCSSPERMDASYAQNAACGFISFAADQRNLNDIPAYPKAPYRENADNIARLADAKNFLYLINPEKFKTKADFIRAAAATNYDLIVMDLYLNDDVFTRAEIEQLKHKKNGGRRMVVCYLSVGEAEDYRPYWKADWKAKKPDWLLAENPDWKGNFKVKYWDKDWQSLIYGNDASYLKKIVDAGFDGAYLDMIDSFEYFE